MCIDLTYQDYITTGWRSFLVLSFIADNIGGDVTNESDGLLCVYFLINVVHSGPLKAIQYFIQWDTVGKYIVNY